MISILFLSFSTLKKKEEKQADMMDIILAVDVGSSSIRCTAFSTEGTNVTLLAGFVAQMEVRSVEPNTGHVLLTTEEGNENNGDGSDNPPPPQTSTMDRVA